jgi:hypothetical protein
MAALASVSPEWLEAAEQIAKQHVAERDAGRRGYLAQPLLIASILSAIDRGLSPQQAAIAAGCSPQMVAEYIRIGELDLAAGRETARATFTSWAKMAWERRRMRLLGTVESASQAGPQYWASGAWLLERGYGADFKLQADTGKGQVIVNVGVIGAADVRIGGADTPILPQDVSIPASDPQPHNVVDVSVIPVTD